MKEIIKKKLTEIEKEKNIKIIFCIEAGSRAWRLENNNSDHDIGFVFKRPTKEYISINKPGEVINYNYDKKGRKSQAEGCYIDMIGFDIFKFSRMLSASNPTVIEWLNSDIIYKGDKPKIWVDYAETQFKRISLYYHYKSMCRQNYLKYLKTRNLVTYKKYMYAMRGLINAKYILLDYGLPPINFNETLLDISRIQLSGWKDEVVPPHIILRLWDILKLKKKGKEKDIIKNIPQIDKYIEKFLKDNKESPQNKNLSTNQVLDNELRRQLKC